MRLISSTVDAMPISAIAATNAPGLSAGFVPLDSPVHIARWHKPLSDADKAAMTEEIFAIGLF